MRRQLLNFFNGLDNVKWGQNILFDWLLTSIAWVSMQPLYMDFRLVTATESLAASEFTITENRKLYMKDFGKMAVCSENNFTAIFGCRELKVRFAA